MKALPYMLNAQSHWLRVSAGGAFGSLILAPLVLLLTMTRCSHREANALKESNYEDSVWSLSLSGSNGASVINKKTRDLRLTVDAGKAWRVIPSAAVGDGFECAFILNENRGWAVNHSGEVFTTKSGGRNWAKISEFKDFTGAHQIEFLDERVGWLQEFLSIWRTEDGGVTWRKTISSATPGVEGSIGSMFVVGSDHVVACGSGGQVYITKDGGENWRIETPIRGNVSLGDLWFSDQTHGWVTGYVVVVAGEKLRPIILETTDGGDSWTEVSVEADVLPSSICVAGDVWWLAGNRRIVNGESINLAVVLFHSGDAGKHWSEIKFAMDGPTTTQVRFTDNQHGWLVAGDGVYRSEDAGRSWHQALSLSQQ
jgi:photosystem II stability/assembly factor-like uncharacterized protein